MRSDWPQSWRHYILNCLPVYAAVRPRTLAVSAAQLSVPLWICWLLHFESIVARSKALNAGVYVVRPRHQAVLLPPPADDRTAGRYAVCLYITRTFRRATVLHSRILILSRRLSQDLETHSMRFLCQSINIYLVLCATCHPLIINKRNCIAENRFWYRLRI